MTPEEFVETVKDQTILRVDPIKWTCTADFDPTKLAEAALAYARPIVVEECAVLVAEKARALASVGFGSPSLVVVRDAIIKVSEAFATAIRKHGKGSAK